MLKFFTTILFISCCMMNHVLAQLPTPALIGYWHNWNDINAPYLPLNSIDPRYNVIIVAFAVPVSPTDMTMQFVPDMISSTDFISGVQSLQSIGKKVLLSIGGATTGIDLSDTANRNAFVNSINNLLDVFHFDGIDIDIENGASILNTGGTITNPANPAQVNLIDAIKQIMGHYRITHQGAKMLLTMAPETAYIQGGQSGFGSIWGGYLPIVHALRDSLDMLHVQLYNSGSMYGIDGGIYYQSTPDFIVALTEASILGFQTAGGFFSGLPQSKIAVGLPACPNAAGGGYVDSLTLDAAMRYLLGTGPQAGNYSLQTPSGYPMLAGMMTWSVNWDALDNCASSWSFAGAFQHLFSDPLSLEEQPRWSDHTRCAFFALASEQIRVHETSNHTSFSILSIDGRRCKTGSITHGCISLSGLSPGHYFVHYRQGLIEQNLRVCIYE